MKLWIPQCGESWKMKSQNRKIQSRSSQRNAEYESWDSTGIIFRKRVWSSDSEQPNSSPTKSDRINKGIGFNRGDSDHWTTGTFAISRYHHGITMHLVLVDSLYLVDCSKKNWKIAQRRWAWIRDLSNRTSIPQRSESLKSEHELHKLHTWTSCYEVGYWPLWAGPTFQSVLEFRAPARTYKGNTRY